MSEVTLRGSFGNGSRAMVEYRRKNGVGPFDLLSGGQQRGCVFQTGLADVESVIMRVHASHEVDLQVKGLVAVTNRTVPQEAIRFAELRSL